LLKLTFPATQALVDSGGLSFFTSFKKFAAKCSFNINILYNVHQNLSWTGRTGSMSSMENAAWLGATKSGEDVSKPSAWRVVTPIV